MTHHPLPRRQHWLINIRSGNGAGSYLHEEMSHVEGITASAINFTSLDEQISSIPPEDIVVVAGGDGTFASVLGSPCLRERHVACVPLGTANDLARELGTSRLVRGVPLRDLPHSLAPLATRPFAVWQVAVNGDLKTFVNYVSIGYEGAVVSDFARWRDTTRHSGRFKNRMAYALFGTRHALTRIRGLSVTSDSLPSISCSPTTGIIVTNIKSHLGLGHSNSESCPYDETVECVTVPTVFGFASMIGASLGVLPPPSVLTRGKTIRITGIPDQTPMQIDGETSTPVTGGTLECTLKHVAHVCISR